MNQLLTFAPQASSIYEAGSGPLIIHPPKLVVMFEMLSFLADFSAIIAALLIILGASPRRLQKNGDPNVSQVLPVCRFHLQTAIA